MPVKSVAEGEGATGELRHERQGRARKACQAAKASATTTRAPPPSPRTT